MDADEEAHFTFIWRIENFSFPCCVDSPSFIVKDMEMTKFHLQLNWKISGSVRLGIWREPEDSGPKSAKIKCEFSFFRIDGFRFITTAPLRQFKHGSWHFNYVTDDAQTMFLRRRAEFLQKVTLTVRCRMRRTGTEVSNPDLCFAHTLLRADRRSFVLAITEFSTLQRGQIRKFLLNPNSTKKMTINFFITEIEGEQFFFFQILSSRSNYPFHIKISLLDFEGKVVHSKEIILLDLGGAPLLMNFIKMTALTDNKESLLPNDVLSLRIEIQMCAKIVGSRIESYRYLNTTNLGEIATEAGDLLRCEQYEETDSSSFKDAMKSQLEEDISSDVSLQAGGQSFPAPKRILSARSAVFRAIFDTDMLEKTSECVPIPDLTADTLRALLSYIYTDTVGELHWQAAADLYTGAEKYQLLHLKKRCTSFLRSALSASNFCAIWTVADLHQDRKLQETVHDFVRHQGEAFFTSDEWRSFREENSAVAWEIWSQCFAI